MFYGIDPDEFVTLDESEARVGYKTLAVTVFHPEYDGLLGTTARARIESPMQGTEWEEPVLEVRRVCGGRKSIVGVYAYLDRDAARPWSFHGPQSKTVYRCKVAAKVALYGQVARYGKRTFGRGGYRAQKARVLQIQLPRTAPPHVARTIKAMSPEWRKVIVSRREI